MLSSLDRRRDKTLKLLENPLNARRFDDL